MSGRGDVVLADLRRAEATLRLPPDAGATLILRGPKNLLAEIPGSQEARALALPSGHYTVERRAAEGFASADFDLHHAEDRALPPLAPSRYERARQKGGPSPLVAFAGGGVAALPFPAFRLAPSLRAGVRKEVGDLGLRFQAEVARGQVSSGPLQYTSWAAAGSVALVAPLYAGPVFVEGGALVGYAVANQALAGGSSYTASGPLAGGVLQATRRFGSVRLGVDVQADARMFRLNDATIVRPGLSFALVAVFSP
jgi:hypothetical protein